MKWYNIIIVFQNLLIVGIFNNIFLFISEFHSLDMNVLVKALKTLELKGRCELMEFDDSQGVKFFWDCEFVTLFLMQLQ